MDEKRTAAPTFIIFYYLFGFGFFLVRLGQRLLLGLCGAFGKEVLKFVGVNDFWLLQKVPQGVITMIKREIERQRKPRINQQIIRNDLSHLIKRPLSFDSYFLSWIWILVQ